MILLVIAVIAAVMIARRMPANPFDIPTELPD